MLEGALEGVLEGALEGVLDVPGGQGRIEGKGFESKTSSRKLGTARKANT